MKKLKKSNTEIDKLEKHNLVTKIILKSLAILLLGVIWFLYDINLEYQAKFIELKTENESLRVEVDRLQEENEIFSSMLSEKENDGSDE